MYNPPKYAGHMYAGGQVGGSAFGQGSAAAPETQQIDESKRGSRKARRDAIGEIGQPPKDQVNWQGLALGAAELAGGFIPGVGEAIDARNAYNSYQSGDYLGAGISAASAAIGLVPVVGDVAATGLRTANKFRQAAGVATDVARAGKFDTAKDVALTVPGAVDVYNQNVTPNEPPPAPIESDSDPFGTGHVYNTKAVKEATSYVQSGYEEAAGGGWQGGSDDDDHDSIRNGYDLQQ